MKESREEAELPFHLMNNRSKPDFWASSSCCLEALHCEDCCFVVRKGSGATTNMDAAPSPHSPKLLLASESPARLHVGHLGYT